MTEVEFLRHWRVPTAAGPEWLETFAPLQFVAYPLRDGTGRPLGEGNLPPELRPPIDEKPCPYPDSRAGLPMNTTALRALREDWAWILRATGALRAARPPRAPRPTAAELWRLGAAATLVPVFLVRTGAAPLDGVPRPVASWFKVAQGVGMAGWDALRRGAEPGDVEGWLRFVHDRRLLHGAGSSRVCGAPEALLRELFAAVVDGGDAPPLPDAGPLLAYADAYAASMIQRWRDHAPRDPAEADRALAVQRALLPGLPTDPDEALTATQQAMNAATGRPPPPGAFDRAWRASLHPTP